MYAKIFRQIYESSIAENPQVRFTFMDLLVLADSDGVVDMTHEAIARITNVPLDWVKSSIAALEEPDHRSRTPNENGARIVRLDAHRDWGWIIVNYDRFREAATDEQRRVKTKERVRRFREKTRKTEQNEVCNAHVTQGNAGVTPPYASPSPSPSASGVGGAGEGNRARRNHEPNQDANIPSLEEVMDHGSMVAATKETCQRFFEHHQSQNVWLNQFGRLIDWRTKLRMWRDDDRQRGTTNGARYSKFINPHAQLRAIEEEIAKHPANPDSLRRSAKPTADQRADLKALRQKHETLNSQIARV